MGRPESPITWDGPVAELACALRALRARAGQPPYREMAEDPRCLSRFSLLAEAARGRTCPTWQVLSDYVTVCGERPEDWRELWERAHKPPRRRRRAVARQMPTASSSTAATRTRVQHPVPPAPDPWQASSAREFVLALRELRAWSGQRSYYDVAAAAGSRLAKSTLYDALNPNREHMPPLGIVRAIVVACHANVETWTQAWQRLRLQEHYQAPLPARPSIVRRDPFPLPAPGLATPLRGGPDANGHKPLGGRFGELTRLTSAQPRSPAGPSETAFDAALEDFERLRTSMSYPALLTAPPSDPDPGSGEVRGDLLTTEADGDHGGRRHLPADAPERLNDHPV